MAPRESVPERTCIGCGAKRPKTALQRLCLSSEGRAQLDGARSGTGRGAYLCGVGCLKAAVQRRALERAFRGRAQSIDLPALEAALGAAKS